MISKVFTEKHTFSIVLEVSNNKTYFEIIATDLTKNTKSSITNLNFIISELIEPIYKIEDYESIFMINNEIGKNLFFSSVNSFSNKEWVKYLEVMIENDKQEGEWN